MQVKKGKDSNIKLYEHQVGGHHCIIASNGYIFKPYSEREALMYSFIPYKYPQLIPFLAKFYGVTDILDTDSSTTKTSKLSITSKDPILTKEPSTAELITHKQNEHTEKMEWVKKLLHKHLSTKPTSSV